MKRNFTTITLLSFFIVLFASCSSVKIDTVKNDEKKILDCKGIVVFANTQDISFRKNIENGIKEQFSKYGKQTIESITLLPPVKEYTENEIYEICRNNKYDSILFVSQMGAEKQTSYVIGYNLLIPASTVISSFDVQLIDLKDNQTVLRSTVTSEGDTLNSMAKSISKKIVSEIETKLCEEFIPIVQNLLLPEITLKSLPKNKYSLIGTSEIGQLSVTSSSFEIHLPIKFNSINDPEKIAKIINSEPKYCKISTNNVEDLPYIVDLIKEFNKIEK